MTVKKTPGPWKYAKAKKSVGILIYRNDGAGINHVRICRNVITESDAALIAAAPDLLEALKLFVERDCSITTEEFKMGRIAIAKAEAR